MNKSKRIVVVADLHCGHRVGLTPPEYQLNPENDYDAKWQKVQVEHWKWYVRKIKALQPIYLLLVVGDVVDGPSERANSRDSIRTQRKDQVNMALTSLDLARADYVEMVYGTRSHVSDWENDVCSSLAGETKIGAHGFPNVNGLQFDVKHKIGSSSIPHGRATALLKSKLWNSLWAEQTLQPEADILLRGHVHYHEAVKTRTSHGRGWAMTCPALQGMGSEFGAEQCEGLVDFGFLVFDVDPKGEYSWYDKTAQLESPKALPTTY